MKNINSSVFCRLCSLVVVSFFLCTISPICHAQSEYIQYVDPMIGTAGHAHSFPGATTPFGMIQLSPNNGFKNWDWCGGYHYSDSTISGFAHNHISGSGTTGLGDILFMPITGKVTINSGKENDLISGYRSRFSHDNETASVGYYSVLLEDYNVEVELTATERVGIHRYTCIDENTLNVIIDPTHLMVGRIINSGVELISDTEIRGFKHSVAHTDGERKVYFYAKFSKPILENQLIINDSLVLKTNVVEGVNTKSILRFEMLKGESLEVKVALSFVNYEGAKKNYHEEADNLNFEDAFALAQKKWDEKLSKIVISGSEKDKRMFYTAMYHSFISPNLISDVDGKYVIGGKTYISDFDQYSNFSTWDTYRALHPLYTIIEHDKTRDFVNSLTSRYTVSQVGLPGWELGGFDNITMIGYNAAAPMAEAILKKIQGIDIEGAYEAMKAAAFSLEKHSHNYDVNGMEYYIKDGFIPGEIGASVSKVTEQNYYDWAISKVASKLGKKEDAKFFEKRSLGFLELYHEKEQFLWPKLMDGSWLDMDLTSWDDLIRNYVSGNIWAYSAYTPHAMGAMINRMGGDRKYEKWLDQIMSDTTKLSGGLHVDISGFIGKYAHGDEPGHQMPYLYNYVGVPHKTQELVRQVTKTMYFDSPVGFVNNEDMGQMSAWYIFSTLGFYPVNPASLQYVIGTPHYKNAIIKTESGGVFEIKADKVSPTNIHIQSARLNGDDYPYTFIRHEDIMKGGILEFEMGESPSNWGSGKKVTSELVGNASRKSTK